MAERIEVTREGTTLPGWIRPSTTEGKRPAVLIVPSIFGSDDGTRSLLDAFGAFAGPVGLPDLFTRTDPGPTGFDEDGRTRALARMRSYDRELGVPDLAAWAAHLRAQPGCDGHVVAFGICFGGHLGLLLAAQSAADGVVTVHGGGMDKVLASGVKVLAPLSMHFGDADPSIGPDARAAIAKAFEGRDDVEIVVHPGAKHGFSHPGNPVFDQAAYDASVASLKAMVDRIRAA